MDALGWLGLREQADGNLLQVQDAVQSVLPEEEAVVIRYVVIVAVLLSRVAWADGGVQRCEQEHLRMLFRHVDRLPPTGVEPLCEKLDERVPRLTPAELKACYRELKSLCDAKERRQVMRLLARLAAVDGQISAAERAELLSIGAELDVPEDVTLGMLREALADLTPPPPAVASSRSRSARARPMG